MPGKKNAETFGFLLKSPRAFERRGNIKAAPVGPKPEFKPTPVPPPYSRRPVQSQPASSEQPVPLAKP